MQIFENSISQTARFKKSVFLCVFSLFYTFRISFLLNINQYVLASIVSLLLLATYITNRTIFKLDATINRMIILFLIASIFATRGNINSYIGIVLLIIPFIFICFLRKEYKLSLIQYLDKFLSVTITISLIAWGLYLLGFPLPHNY